MCVHSAYLRVQKMWFSLGDAVSPLMYLPPKKNYGPNCDFGRAKCLVLKDFSSTLDTSPPSARPGLQQHRPAPGDGHAARLAPVGRGGGFWEAEEEAEE